MRPSRTPTADRAEEILLEMSKAGQPDLKKYMDKRVQRMLHSHAPSRSSSNAISLSL
jgi:hypothetical protein